MSALDDLITKESAQSPSDVSPLDALIAKESGVQTTSPQTPWGNYSYSDESNNPNPITSNPDFHLDLSGVAKPAQVDVKPSAYMDEINKARSNINPVVDNLKNLLYGGAKGSADLVQGYGQAIINGAAALSGDGPAGQFVKRSANQFNDYLHNQEAGYQSDTKDSFTAGLGRVGAQVAPFLFSGGTSAAPEAMPMAQQMARSMFQGGLFGGDNVASDVKTAQDGSNNYFDQKSKQIVSSGLTGGLLTPIAAGAARVISPKTSDSVLGLLDQGITPTPGQILGKGWAQFEDKLTSIPVVGDMIKNAQRRSIDDFNRAAYNRALAPIGESSTLPIGREGISEVSDKLGNAYDSLLPKLNFQSDPIFKSDISNLRNLAQNMPPAQSAQFENIFKNKVESRMTPQGNMTGETVKGVQSELNNLSKGYQSDPSFDNRQLGTAIDEVLNSVRGSLTRTNPNYASELNNINSGYANYVRLRQAAGSLGAEEGAFTPAQLQNSVKANDSSAGKGDFARGNALLQDLSEPGKSVLGNHYPNSGTPGRAIIAGIPAAAFAAYTHPGIALGGGIAGLTAMAPYTPMGQKIAAALLARRPNGSGGVASFVKSVSPLLGASSLPMLSPTGNN